MAKRTGPLVAVILSPASPDDAERLLAQVRYEPSITWSERVPTRRDNIGDLVINAFELIGILLGFLRCRRTLLWRCAGLAQARPGQRAGRKP